MPAKRKNTSVRRSKKGLKRAVSGVLKSRRGLRGLGGDKDYWTTRSAAEKRALKKNPGKTVRLTNFSGTITRQRNGQVKITGRKRTVRKRK